VSSSTVALQHQYAKKDAPTIQRLLPLGFTFAVAKGRRRYACTAKLGAQARDAGQEELDLEQGRAPAAADQASRRRRTILTELAESFDARRWNGDRDELAVPVADEIWNGLTTDRQGCSGNKCGEFARCPFFAARQRVKDADLVIANHDLVLSSLKMEAGSVLPPLAQTIYVFDEAHSLAAKVVEHFSARHALRGANAWVDGAVEAVRDAVLALRLDERFLRDAVASGECVRQALGELFDHVHGTAAFEDKRARRFRDAALPDWVIDGGGRVLEGTAALQQTFSGLRQALLERAACEGSLATRVLGALGFFAVKLEHMADTWSLMLADDSQQDSPIARWVERHEDASGERDYRVCAAPISGSERLRKLLWNRASGAVLMSATLTSCGSFELFLQQSGLSRLRGVQLLQVDSPFD